MEMRELYKPEAARAPSVEPVAMGLAGALARALPSLHETPGADPFEPAVLAGAVLDNVRNMQEYTKGLARETSERGARLSSYANEAEMHAVQDQAACYWDARDSAVQRYAAASLVLSCLPRAVQVDDVRKVAEEFRACDLLTLLGREDRAAFARWLLEAEDASVHVRGEAVVDWVEAIEAPPLPRTAL